MAQNTNYPNIPYPPQGQPAGQPVNYIDPRTGLPVAPPQGYVSTGNPEAPVRAPAEAVPAAPEYGNEAIRRIEQQMPNEGGAEHKEIRQPVPQQPVPVQQPKPAAPPPPAGITPKFYGYKVPPQLATNIQAIEAQAGKGDPDQAHTWLIIFLERLLRKQSEK
jgi:hypothetical protein